MTWDEAVAQYNLNLRGFTSYYFFDGNEPTSKGGNYVKMVFAFFWKGVYSKRKEFAPSGSKFFPFRIDPFQKGK